MTLCHQATSHCLSQIWSRSMLPYGITRPEWVYPRGTVVWRLIQSNNQLLFFLFTSNILSFEQILANLSLKIWQKVELSASISTVVKVISIDEYNFLSSSLLLTINLAKKYLMQIHSQFQYVHSRNAFSVILCNLTAVSVLVNMLEIASQERAIARLCSMHNCIC